MKRIWEVNADFKKHFVWMRPKNSNICCNQRHELSSLTILIKFGKLLNILLCSAYKDSAWRFPCHQAGAYVVRVTQELLHASCHPCPKENQKWGCKLWGQALGTSSGDKGLVQNCSDSARGFLNAAEAMELSWCSPWLWFRGLMLDHLPCELCKGLAYRNGTTFRHPT